MILSIRVLDNTCLLERYKKYSNTFTNLNKQKIANALDKASELITLRKESIKKLDELSKSLIDMLHPVLNPKKWKTIKLSKLGYCKNGLN